MGIFSTIMNNHPAILDMIKDPRLKELVTKREFRLTEEYLSREFVGKMADEDISEPAIRIGAGFMELSGKVKKKMLPFAIPFSARFSLHSIDFSQRGKVVHLKLEEVKPFEVDSLTRKLVDRIPFLSYDDGLASLDLTRVPRLAELFDYQIKGMRPFDFLVLKELAFHDGEVVGKVGVCL